MCSRSLHGRVLVSVALVTMMMMGGALGGTAKKAKKVKRPPPSNNFVNDKEDALCGDGKINSGMCQNVGECCSEHGWCGVSDAHCGKGCKGGACIIQAAPVRSPPPPRAPTYPPPAVSAALPTPLTAESIQGCKDPMHMALTYDDGPNEFTWPVLEKLAKHKVFATFFMIGKNVQTRTKMAKAVKELGHEIAHHSYNHNDSTTMTMAAFKADITRADTVFKNIIGVTPRFFRYPFGAHNPQLTAVLTNRTGLNKIPIHWNVDTLDWKVFNTPDVDTIVSGIPAQVDAANNNPNMVNKGPLTLFHPERLKASLDRIDEVVELAKDNGYKLVTLSECLGYYDIYE